MTVSTTKITQVSYSVATETPMCSHVPQEPATPDMANTMQDTAMVTPTSVMLTSTIRNTQPQMVDMETTVTMATTAHVMADTTPTDIRTWNMI